jgi:MFS family permease
LPDARLRRARLGVSAVFMIHAAAFGTWATRIPAIKHHIDIGDGKLGVALTGLAIGLFVGTRIAGGVVDRFGSRPAIRVATLLLCAVLIGPALANDLVALTVTLALLGAVGGFLDVAMNAHTVVVERGYGRPIMSSVHGLWSAGLLFGALAGAGAAGLDLDPRLHFGIVAAVLAVPATLVGRGLLAAGADSLPAELRHHPDASRPSLFLPAILLLGLVSFSSFFGEGAAGDWSAVYLHDSLDTSSGVAATGFAAFSFTMAASRFVSDGLQTRFGPVTLVRVGSLVAAAGLALGLAIHRPAAAIVGFALLGVGFAPVVPIAFSAAGNTGLGPTGVLLGRVVTMGYLGSIVGPVLIGGIAQLTGLRAALVLIVVLALVITAAAGSLSSAAGEAHVPTPAWPGA